MLARSKEGLIKIGERSGRRRFATRPASDLDGDEKAEVVEEMNMWESSSLSL